MEKMNLLRAFGCNNKQKNFISKMKFVLSVTTSLTFKEKKIAKRTSEMTFAQYIIKCVNTNYVFPICKFKIT